MKRLTDTNIWDEDWFIDLPNDYKLFFLYIKDKCDHSGMWRPNRRKFSMTVHGKIIPYDDFLHQVNKDAETGIPKNRIIVLENGKWFLTKYITFQCGNVFNIKNGAHRGALKLLISNNIHPNSVPGMDWQGMENYDLERLKELGHGSGLYALSKDYVSSRGAVIEKKNEKEPDKEKEKLGKGGVGEKPIFKLQHLYDRPWSEVNPMDKEFRGISEADFKTWKKFVDLVASNDQYSELFKAIFVNPSDFTVIVKKHDFQEDRWKPVIEKMLSTGIKAEHNLYFRIPDFIKYAKSSNKQASASPLNAGDTNYHDQEKW